MSIISPSGLSGDYYYITILVIVLVLFYCLGSVLAEDEDERIYLSLSELLGANRERSV